MFDLGLGLPLVEVEVLTVDLDLAALEVSRFGTQRMFGRKKFASPIEVDNQAIAVLVSTIKVGYTRVVGGLYSVRGVGW